MDVLLAAFDPLVQEYNGKIDTINTFVNSLDGVLSALQVPEMPLLEFDSSTCRFTANADLLKLSITTHSVSLVPWSNLSHIDLDADGSFDLAEIGVAIKDSCKEAAQDLAENDRVECCGAAREANGIPPEGKPVEDTCSLNFECASKLCIGGFCTDGSLGSTCRYVNNNCNSDLTCTGNFPARCAQKLADRSSCGVGNHASCQSDACIKGECSSGKTGDTCTKINSQWCDSGSCKGFFPPRCA